MFVLHREMGLQKAPCNAQRGCNPGFAWNMLCTLLVYTTLPTNVHTNSVTRGC